MVEEEIFSSSQGLVELRLLPQNARLRKARKEKGFTQKDLSLITGISLSSIQKIEKCLIVPTWEEMEEISSALGRPAEFLFPPELMEAIKAGVFHEHLITFTEANGLGYRPALTSGTEEVERDFLRDQIEKILEALTPREQKVLTLRFGLNDGKERSFKEIGREFGLTGERIRQIVTKALRDLRLSASRELKDFLD